MAKRRTPRWGFLLLPYPAWLRGGSLQKDTKEESHVCRRAEEDTRWRRGPALSGCSGDAKQCRAGERCYQPSETRIGILKKKKREMMRAVEGGGFRSDKFFSSKSNNTISMYRVAHLSQLKLCLYIFSFVVAERRKKKIEARGGGNGIK